MKGKKNWRLSKTLSRRVQFRPIENDDVKFAWAAYNGGALAPMAGVFAERGLTPAQFKEQFEGTVISRYSGAWTLLANGQRGWMPAGFIFAFYSHKEPALSPFMIIGDIIWCPWATKRNKLECAVNFFNATRKEIPMMDYAHGETNQRFFETMAMHGVMRRVGTTFNVVKGEAVAIFETRAP